MNESIVFLFQIPNDNIVINCIEHSEYNFVSQSDVTILDGGIGKSFVKLRIKNKQGESIKSTIIFYYQHNDAKLGKLSIDDFLETNIIVVGDD